MGSWHAESTFEAPVDPEAVWERCYADPVAWPEWNSEMVSAEGSLEQDGSVRVRFRRGPPMRFRVTELERGRLFTDEARLPGARMGHRHLVEPVAEGVRLTNRIYIDGPLTGLWSRVLGRRARRELPGAQRRIAALAAEAHRG